MWFDWSKLSSTGYPFMAAQPIIVWDSGKKASSGSIDEGQLSMGIIRSGVGVVMDTSMGVF